MSHAVFEILANLGLGLALGAVGGMLGIGGGLIAIPVLQLMYGMDQHMAQGTALIMIVPNVLIGFLRYRQRNQIALRSLAPMSILAVATSYMAARWAEEIDARALQFAFAMFLIVISVYFLLQLRRKERVGGPALSERFMPLIGAASGVMSGLFTVGGGLVVVPALVSLFRMTQTKAQGIALALVVPGSLVALYAYARAGNVGWSIGLPLALGGVFSVSWGVHLAHRFPPPVLRMLFCGVLLLTAAMLIAQ